MLTNSVQAEPATRIAVDSGHLAALDNPQRNPGSNEGRFSVLIDRYFDFLFRLSPNFASQLGLHQHDSKMPDYSPVAMEQRIKELKQFLKEFEAVSTAELKGQSRIDLALVNADIKARLLELEEIQDWKKNPDYYSSEASSCIYNLMTREYAPLEERLKSVISREKKIGALLSSGKQNLTKPVKIYTEIALEQMPGIIDFFQNSVPEKFKSVSNKELQAEFEQTNRMVIDELKNYSHFLKEQILPHASESFAIGKDCYSKKLLYDEMVDTPLDQLLATGEAELKRLQAEFNSTALALDPNKSPTETFASISTDHSSPNKLISSTAGILNQLKDFCLEKKIVSLPTQEDLQVAETPPFMRALIFAAMDCPGPFEEKAKEAYYYVTLPETSWDPQRVEEHMRAYCRYDLMNTSVHEAYPGHFVQGLWSRKSPSKTTKILGCDSNVEGWAHYCEQMMVEQGLENGDNKLKLIQLHDALLRACRYVCGIRLHTKDMSVKEAIAFFQTEGYQEKSNAEREAKRGTMDPTYLVYTLGKLQILSLRNDYKKFKGADFSLQDFHDRFLSLGCPPVKIIREVMLRKTQESE